jgi:rhamnosyltransferase
MPSISRTVPHIAVLLATYNGRRWLPEQLASILGQEGVTVRVIALDDGSTDGTVEWLAETAAAEPRLVVLEPGTPSGSAAANFYRLIARAPVDDADYIAFADQDDIWSPGKFARHVGLIHQHGCEGVSGSVMSFTPGGSRTLIKKDYPQRRFDYLAESPGPGCTFLLTPKLFALAREVITTDNSATGADFHDSLVYAVARAHGLRWHIDGLSTIDYRQHDNNVMGSNVGAAPALSRLSLIRARWHRNQAVLMGRIGLVVASPELKPGLERMISLMTATGIRARFALARQAGQLRRRPRDRWIIGFLIATGVW